MSLLLSRRGLMLSQIKYTPIEYLYTTDDLRTDWIDTGYIPNNETGLEVVFSTSANVDRPMGVRQDGGNTRFYAPYPYTGYFGYGFNSFSGVGLGTPSANTKYILSINLFNSRNVASATGNGTPIGRYSLNEFGILNTISRPIYLLNYNNKGEANSYAAGIKFWGARITQGDEVVRSFIPAKDSKGVVCLYEEIECKFYYNKGTMPLLAGGAE